MNQEKWQNYQLETLAIRAGHERTHEGEHGEPIYPTSSFVFDSAADAAAIFSGEKQGNIYARFTNPTVRNFEQRLAAMEGGERCVATASGMSAILATVLGLLESGDHIVSSRSIFGSTVILFNNFLKKLKIDVTYVDIADIDQWDAAVQGNTKMFFLETPSNPLIEVCDIEALSKVSKKHSCYFVVDNCFCTPALQRPLKLGADIVVHSATKYIDGQGRCLGGAVVGSNDVVGEGVYAFLRSAGPSMSPFNAWVFLKGLETLSLRMGAHSKNTLELAKWLEAQDMIERVYYPGLESHPQHDIAKKQQSAFGGILAFEVKGGRDNAWKVVDSTEICSITANLGDTKTTITHPASTTHGRLTEEQRAEVGIKQSMLRVAVGLENLDDIKADLLRGLSQL
jgi:O-succinylhomoserine sulfhydrylase